MRISLALLEAKGSCKNQLVLFESFLSGRSFCLLTPRNLILARKAGLDVFWFIETFGASLIGHRGSFLGTPYYAYLYSRYVDCGPHDDTRAAVCCSPGWAYYYARFVDCGPHDDTRAAACGDPYESYRYARYVDCGPRDDTQKAACVSPEWAYHYALHLGETSPS